MILADASVWIDFFNGVATGPALRLLQMIREEETLYVADLTYMEVLQGFRTEAHAERALADLDSFKAVPIVGRDNAIEAARCYRLLRRKGITVRKPIDMLIGTYCIVNELYLLHNDRDFDPMEQHLGLNVLH